VIDKGRKEKRNLCKTDGKVFKQLETTANRYAKTFQIAGFNFNVEFDYLFTNSPLNENILSVTGIKESRWIGIAPFAKHKGKIYPLELMEKVMTLLTASKGVTVFLFGGGGYEKGVLEGWENQFPNTISLVGKFGLEDELKVISNLDVLVSMDSANMHLASLVNTSVISIWGATHPQNHQHAVQVDLSCRPCSIYGNKPCFRKDYACLHRITPESIVRKINEEIIA